METEVSVVVEVERIRCGQNSRLGQAKVVAGEPYVLAHHEPGDIITLTTKLAVSGQPFSVRLVDRHVSMVEWCNSALDDELGGTI
jgi:hypothetical protein